MNDVFGHVKGDQMIRHCYELIHEALDTDLIYRTVAEINNDIAAIVRVNAADFVQAERFL